MGVQTHKVFVYGSLLAGFQNHDYYLGRARRVWAGRTERAGFRMLDLGSFPGVVKASPGGGTVAGEVYEVTGDELARLDRLEGCPFFYRRGWVRLADGSRAFMYVLNAAGGPSSTAALVPDNDWRSYRAARDAAAV